MTTLLRWDAPTTGPAPDGYELYVDGVLIGETEITEVALPDEDHEAEYEVLSYIDHPHINTSMTYLVRSEPLPYQRGFRITDIDIIPEGVILTFATRIGSTYSIERADTMAGPWTECVRFVADAETSQRGGDPMAERAYYRAWRVQ